MRIIETQQQVIREMREGFLSAVTELTELIDGGEECFGMDSSLSRIIELCDNHARRAAAVLPEEKP